MVLTTTVSILKNTFIQLRTNVKFFTTLDDFNTNNVYIYKHLRKLVKDEGFELLSIVCFKTRYLIAELSARAHRDTLEAFH